MNGPFLTNPYFLAKYENEKNRIKDLSKRLEMIESQLEKLVSKTGVLTALKRKWYSYMRNRYAHEIERSKELERMYWELA